MRFICVVDELLGTTQRPWLAYPGLMRNSFTGGLVRESKSIFVLYGSAGFWAIEVKKERDES
jgi:hypothetical protein